MAKNGTPQNVKTLGGIWKDLQIVVPEGATGMTDGATDREGRIIVYFPVENVTVGCYPGEINLL